MKEVLIIIVPCLLFFIVFHVEDPESISYPSPEFQDHHKAVVAEIEEEKRRELAELSSVVMSLIQRQGN